MDKRRRRGRHRFITAQKKDKREKTNKKGNKYRKEKIK